MLKLALVLALTSTATILTGCSGGDDEPAPAAAAAPGATAPSDGTPSSPAPCPTSGEPSDKPGVAASPLAKCVGYFTNAGGSVSGFLHQTPQGCMLSTSMVLHGDGTVDELTGSKRTGGTWKGDEFYFTILIGQSQYDLWRTKAEPSK